MKVYYVLALCILINTFACVKGATILVGPGRTIKEPADAMSQFTTGTTMIIDDGTYYIPFQVPPTLTAWSIESASGNPYKCVFDGQGGAPNHRLFNGKGFMYVRSPGTIKGIGFINAGGADNVGNGEAGLYAESFASVGELRVINCAFDNNENGIYVPPKVSTGLNVGIYLEACVFSKNAGNGITTDGQSHNYFISGRTLTSVNCAHNPSKYGHNVKSGTESFISDLYNKHGVGRCLDVSSGRLTLRGGVYTASGSSAGTEFMYYGGGAIPLTQDVTIVAAQKNDSIINANIYEWIFYNPTQLWTSNNCLNIRTVRPSPNDRSTIVGLVSCPPSGTTYVQIPDPIYPSWVSPLSVAYVGCLVDYTYGARDLPISIPNNYNTNTNEKCRYQCAMHGYSYSGTQYGFECFCGNSYGSQGVAPSTECNYICPGNATQNCGGESRNSVYKAGKAGFLGCFKDSQSSRDMQIRVYARSDNTPNICRQSCFSQGYTYAGLQWGEECWCGNSFGRLGQTDTSDCNMPCSGDSAFTCGGYDRNTVYTSQLPAGYSY